MKKTYLLIFLSMIACLNLAYAGEDTQAYFFYSTDNIDSYYENIFLDSIKVNFTELTINKYDVTTDAMNLELMKKMADTYNIDNPHTPLIVIGDYHFQDFGSEKTTGSRIISAIKDCINTGCSDAGVKTGIKEEKDTSMLKDEMIEISKSNDIVKLILEKDSSSTPSFDIDEDYIVSWVSGQSKVVVYINKTTKEISKVLNTGLSSAYEHDEMIQKEEQVKRSLKEKIITWIRDFFSL